MLDGKASSSHTHNWTDISNKPDSYPPSSHTHDDRYYTESEVNNLLGGKSDTGHTHDGRYYTESEVNNLLNGKASSSHTHTKSQITDFPSSLPANGGTASRLYDYNNSNRVIQLGFEGAGLNTSNLTHIAGYTDSGTKIKDVSKDVLKSWLGSMPPSSHNHITYGTNINGAYYKFDDGTLICTKRITFTGINCDSSWGAIYETASTYNFGNYAHQFADTPVVTVNQESGTTLIPEAFNNRNNTSIGNTWFYRATAVYNVKCTFAIIAIGRWK